MKQFAFKPPAAELFNPTLLTMEDVDACFTLHEDVRAKLIAKGTPHYLKPLALDGFKKHLDDGGEILGIKHKGLVVAKLHLAFPSDPNDPKLKENFPGVDLENTAVISAVASNMPGYSHASTLLEFAKERAAAHGCPAIVGKVAESNKGSHDKFRSALFDIVARGVDTKQDCIQEDYKFLCFRWPTPVVKIG